MALVKIDLGFGEHAILSARTGSVISTAKHQRDAEEFLRRWPLTRSIEQESGYLRQLGLQLGQTLPGVSPCDTSAQLRAAVKSGKVTVVIERAAPTGGGISASGPTTPPYPLEMREKAAWVAPTRTSLRSYDWLPNYDDVSADDLINYIQSVVGSTPTEAAAPSMALADAQPFEYGDDVPMSDQAEQDAGFFLTPEIEAECEHGLNLDLDECSAWEAAKPGTWSMCHGRSMERYANCLRGRTLD